MILFPPPTDSDSTEQKRFASTRQLGNWREALDSGTLNYNLYLAVCRMGILVAIARMLTFRRLRVPAAVCAIATLIMASALALVAAPQRAKKPPSEPAKEPAGTATPFHAGEVLNYSGQWLKINDVVSARLAVLDDHPFYGHPAWHLQAKAQTRNTLRYIFPMDDQFDSYSTRAELVGLQFEMYLHESAKQETRILRLSSVSAPAPEGATQAQVLPGTRDPLGFVYYLRTVDWQQTSEVRSPVFDGHKLYEVRASVTTARREITVPAGMFTATGIAIRVFDRGTEVATIKVTVWLAQDAARTPVLIEAELPYGTGRVELGPAALPN